MGFYPSSCGSTAHNNFHFTAEDLQRERKKVSPDNAGRYDANLPTTHSFFFFEENISMSVDHNEF